MSLASAIPADLAAMRALSPVPRPLERFLVENLELLEERLDVVARELASGLGSLDGVVARALGTEGHGGRRWRPLLTLAAAEAYGARRGAALDVAVAVELTHTASLALDDLPCMDDSPLRRGQPATHRLVGSAGAILLSVGFLSRAVELLGRQRERGGALCADWGHTVGLQGMAGGQAMDVAGGDALRGAQRRLYRAKSSELPAFALTAGAHVAGANEPARLGLQAFGRSLGWAYQLLDDVEDLDEDGGGSASQVERLRARSARIMSQARRRLRRVPGLGREGAELLLRLAGGLVVPDPHATGATPARSR